MMTERTNTRTRLHLLFTCLLALGLIACESLPTASDLADPVAGTEIEAAGKKGKPGGSTSLSVDVTVRSFLPGVALGLGHGISADDADLQGATFHADLNGQSPSIPAAEFFGCPDTEKTCNELTIVAAGFEPETDYVTFSVNYLLEDDACTGTGLCADDDLFQDVLQTDGKLSHPALPLIPVSAMEAQGDGSYRAVLYWQGQRQSDRDFREYFWTRYPNLNGPGEEQFVFRAKKVTRNSNGSRTQTVLASNWHQCRAACRAAYEGEMGVEGLAAVGGAEERTVTSGKGKRATETYYLDIPVTTPGAMSVVDAIIINPDGSKSVNPLGTFAAGETYTVTIEAQNATGCHEIHLVQAYIFDPLHLEHVYPSFSGGDVYSWVPGHGISNSICSPRLLVAP